MTRTNGEILCIGGALLNKRLPAGWWNISFDVAS
jgi:hypothetical protein